MRSCSVRREGVNAPCPGCATGRPAPAPGLSTAGAADTARAVTRNGAPWPHRPGRPCRVPDAAPWRRQRGAAGELLRRAGSSVASMREVFERFRSRPLSAAGARRPAGSRGRAAPACPRRGPGRPRRRTRTGTPAGGSSAALPLERNLRRLTGSLHWPTARGMGRERRTRCAVQRTCG